MLSQFYCPKITCFTYCSHLVLNSSGAYCNPTKDVSGHVHKYVQMSPFRSHAPTKSCIRYNSSISISSGSCWAHLWVHSLVLILFQRWTLRYRGPYIHVGDRLTKLLYSTNPVACVLSTRCMWYSCDPECRFHVIALICREISGRPTGVYWSVQHSPLLSAAQDARKHLCETQRGMEVCSTSSEEGAWTMAFDYL